MTKRKQIQSCKFSLNIRSSVVSIKCRIDQLSFQSSVVSIKCRFDQVSFQLSVVAIECRVVECLIDFFSCLNAYSENFFLLVLKNYLICYVEYFRAELLVVCHNAIPVVKVK